MIIYLLGFIAVVLIALTGIIYTQLNKLLKITRLGNSQLISAVEDQTCGVKERDEVLKQSSLLGDTVLHVNTQMLTILQKMDKFVV